MIIVLGADLRLLLCAVQRKEHLSHAATCCVRGSEVQDRCSWPLIRCTFREIVDTPWFYCFG